MSGFVYLAEPIDFAVGMSFSNRLRTRFFERQIGFYSPKDAWTLYGELPVEAVTRVNNTALLAAAAIVAVLPPDRLTVGTILELEQARQRGQRRYALTQHRRSVALMTMECHIFDDPDMLADAVALFLKDVEYPLQHAELQGRWIQTEERGQAPLPPRHEGDAGYDLCASQTTTIEPNGVGHIPCGIAIELPHGYWCMIQGRSSSWRRGLSVKASIIDNGYRGELWVDCLNLTSYPVTIEAGERIAQMIPFPIVPPIRFDQGGSLSVSSRGANGYGSTGK